jgi:hypothetical protein
VKFNKPENKKYLVPVLIIAFNRPQYIEMQVKALKEVQPRNLFLAIDGPRLSHPEDKDKIEKVKSTYLELINWDCQVKTLFSETNKGCSRGPISAISWFFSEVGEGIILEDDIIPTKDFFLFMQVMLDYYRQNEKVMSVSGCNLGYHSSDNTIVVSKIMNMWGWGTWANRWNLIDFRLNDWKDKSNKIWYLHNKLGVSIFDYDKGWINHWKAIFDKTIEHSDVTWWDYQFIYNQLRLNKLTIFPPVNLVRNLGFDQDATHTFEKDHFSKYLDSLPINWPLTIPKSLKLDSAFYHTHIKEVWSFYKRPNWKFYLGHILKKITLTK